MAPRGASGTQVCEGEVPQSTCPTSPVPPASCGRYAAGSAGPDTYSYPGTRNGTTSVARALLGRGPLQFTKWYGPNVSDGNTLSGSFSAQTITVTGTSCGPGEQQKDAVPDVELRPASRAPRVAFYTHSRRIQINGQTCDALCITGAGGLTGQPKEGQAMMRRQVVVRLTSAQALCCEKLAECLWPAEKLSVEQISRRLLREHLLWVESERNMCEPVRIFPQGHTGRPIP